MFGTISKMNKINFSCRMEELLEVRATIGLLEVIKEVYLKVEYVLLRLFTLLFLKKLVELVISKFIL